MQEASPETKIVVLTMQKEPAFARQALQLGVLGYVLKEAADDELVQAVRSAAAGDTYLQPALGARAGRRTGDRRDRPERARDRRPAPDRPRPHQRRDRREALHQRAHGGDPPCPHPAEARRLAAAPSWSAARSPGASSRPEPASPRCSGSEAITLRAGAGLRFDLQLAAGQLDPLAHPGQAEAAALLRRIEALPVVGDEHLEAILAAAYPQLARVRPPACLATLVRASCARR